MCRDTSSCLSRKSLSMSWQQVLVSVAIYQTTSTLKTHRLTESFSSALLILLIVASSLDSSWVSSKRRSWRLSPKLLKMLLKWLRRSSTCYRHLVPVISKLVVAQLDHLLCLSRVHKNVNGLLARMSTNLSYLTSDRSKVSERNPVWLKLNHILIKI